MCLAGSKILGGWELQRCSASFQPDLPIEEWDIDTIAAWFDNLGLYMYRYTVVLLTQQLALFVIKIA